MEETILTDVIKLIDATYSKQRVDKFIRIKYDEYISSSLFDGAWNRMIDYDIVSWFIIKVTFEYGWSENINIDTFIINLKDGINE